MRMNKSIKDTSFARGRGSRGKEMSVELQTNQKLKPATSSRYQNDIQNRIASDRLNNSHNWQPNPSISQNILKEIINYSNISNCSLKNSKGSTIAVYEKSGDDVYSQLNKIKKNSLGELGLGLGLGRKRESKKLVIDYPESKQIMVEQMGKSIVMQHSETKISVKIPEPTQQNQKDIPPWNSQQINQSSLLRYQITPDQLHEIQKQKSQLAIKLDQLTYLQESISLEYSQMIPYWQQLMISDNIINQLDGQSNIAHHNINKLKEQLEEYNLNMLAINKQYVASKRKWAQKGNGLRSRTLDEAESIHQEFIRKVTIKDFDDTVLFNMKVAIPDHRGKTTVKGIYQELFRSHSTKKFTMILKKHTSQMDLYQGKLLSDFTKRINQLQTQFLKAQFQNNQHPQQQYYIQQMDQLTCQIDRIRTEITNASTAYSRSNLELQHHKEQSRKCERHIHQLIDQLNFQVRGQYEKETDKAADFKSLLLCKYNGKYRQFKNAREKKEQLSKEAQKLQQKLQQLRSHLK